MMEFAMVKPSRCAATILQRTFGRSRRAQPLRHGGDTRSDFPLVSADRKPATVACVPELSSRPSLPPLDAAAVSSDPDSCAGSEPSLLFELLTAHMAACVRFCTRIFRSKALICTLTVASATSRYRAMLL